MKLFKTITPPLWRVMVFLCLFVLISGLIGPRIISAGIMLRDGFGIYGGIGKAMIFGCIAFVLLARHSKKQFKINAWQRTQTGWFVAALVAFGIASGGIDGLIAGQQTWSNVVAAHGGLLLAVAFAGLGTFGVPNIRHLWHTYRQELVRAALLSVAFYVFLWVVYALWQPLASIVMWSVQGLLGITNLQAVVVPPNTLIFDKFGITIAEYCSGIESIALFTSLYAVVGLLDWPHVNRRRYFMIFPFALLMLFCLNIVRVYGLIIAGYYINPDIAFSLFHTYAGMVFFIVYSIIFWAIAYKYLVTKPPAGQKT
jgi:exosortase/archaeosortase family protein